MLGYHPAFSISKMSTVYCSTKNQKTTIEEVLEKGGDAYPIFNVNKISLFKNNKFGIDILTEGFHNFMLWTEVDSMLCVEPITQYPNLEKQKYSEENMRLSKGKDMFTVELKPFKV